MLGAVSYGVKYTGIDTNISLKPIYKLMMDELKGDTHMIWEDCLKVDFATINYDMVLTSPPYINKELYEHMKPFENNKVYYKKFLIPLINKCLANIKNNGFVCININKEYYDCLLGYGYREADDIIEYQQSSRKKEGKSKMEYVYCWINKLEIKEVKEDKEVKKECNNKKCNNCLLLAEENRELRRKIEQLKLLI
jgi:DNA modification methylase